MLDSPNRVVEKLLSPMLGLRLEPELQQQLTTLSRRIGRSKSEIAREAVREYLVRHDDEAEFRRQVIALNDSYTPEDVASHDARVSEWLRALDEEDGGYDWGENGPPV